MGVTSLARIGRGGGLNARTTGDRCTDGADSQDQAGKSDWGQDVWFRWLGKGHEIIGVVYRNSRVWDLGVLCLGGAGEGERSVSCHGSACR